MWLYDTTGFLGIGSLTAIIPFVIMSGYAHGFEFRRIPNAGNDWI